MAMAPLKIIFAGTPDFSLPCLKALVETGHQLISVYTQPDRPAGRGRKLSPSPVKVYADAAGMTVRQPLTLRDHQEVEILRGFGADLMVVVAYGLLLPREVLGAPRLGCVNVHASLLPRWRGAAPIQRAILAGDSETGITIMHMEAGLDTGPTYLSRRLLLDPHETGGSLTPKLALLGAQALIEALPGIVAGDQVPQPQDDTQATYASKIVKAEAQVDWSRSAVEIDRLIRAFNPWPVAQTQLGETSLRIWDSQLSDGVSAGASPGEVLRTAKSGIEVATGRGALRLTQLQLPGKRPMSAAEFLNSRDLAGARFG